MDEEEASPIKKHQSGAIHPIVNCDKKASYSDDVFVSSIVVIILADNVMNFYRRLLTRWETSFLKFHRHTM